MPSIAIGTIMPFAGNCNEPAVAANLRAQGWLPCWGQLVGIADYPDLERLIGNHYGGDKTSIALPDLRGRFIRGAAPGTAPIATLQASATAAPAKGPFTLDDSGAHTHTFDNVPAWDNSSSRVAGHSTYNWNAGSAPSSAPLPNPTHTHSVTGGGDGESRPVNVYVDYIIKVAAASSKG
jgi:microcystin-dependent protein